MKLKRIPLGLLAVSLLMTGCATIKVDSPWREQAIAVDGNDREWSGSPQYYDKDRQLVIRVTNDAQAMFLCVSTTDSRLGSQLRMTGMTVWLDPGGAQAHIFGIHLPGGAPQGPHQAPRSGGGAPGIPPESRAPAPMPKGSPPPAAPLEELAITYADTTGPLTMKIEEVRRTGIDIGAGQCNGNRWVFEFEIAFNSAPSLAALGPGRLVGVGLQTGTAEQEGSGGSFPGGEMGGISSYGSDEPSIVSTGGSTGHVTFGGGPGPPGGGGRGGPRGGRPGKKGDALDVWLQIRLAGQAAG